MKYQVDRKALASLLLERPALIKKVTTVTEEFILEAYTAHQGNYGYGNGAAEL